MADRGSTSGDILLHALDNLIDDEFKRFKDKLSDIDFKGRQNIPRGSLEGKGRIDTKNLLVQFYGSDSAIDVTIEAFTKVSLIEAAAKIREERQRVLQPKLSSSIQGETTDFRGINMEHIFEQSRLIDRNARVGETVPLQKKYTKHLIVQQHPNEKERQHEIMSYGWKHTEIMDRLVHSKLYFHLDSLFDSMKDGHRPRTVVLQGPAGIGKTMTAQKIMLDWTLGKLYRELFDYVFYLNCREINRVRSDNSVFDVIAAGCPERTVPRRVLLADPSKILLILDGFDELKFSLDLKEDQLCRDPHQRNPVEVTLSNLLRRNILPGCTLIVTTRPTALERLRQCIKADLCAEIIGFTEEDRKSYFSSFFGNDEQASRALAVVKDNDTLYTMCFLPIVCSIVCTVMKQEIEKGQDTTNSSKTTTEVYLSFLSTLLSDHSGASSETMQRSLKKLCSLALNGVFEQRILFYEEDLQQFDLEVSDIQSLFLNQTIFHRDIDVYSAHSFIHLSFQEFFAALFYILDIDEGSPNPQRDLKHLLKEYSQQTKGHLMLTVRFLFGLINKDQLHHVEKILGCKISLSARGDLVAWLQDLKQESLLLDVFHCLHEAQDGDMISTTMNNIQSIQIKKSDYSIVNLKAISFGLMHCQGDKTLNLRHVHFGPKAQEIMRPGMINCSTLRRQLKTWLFAQAYSDQASLSPWSRSQHECQETIGERVLNKCFLHNITSSRDVMFYMIHKRGTSNEDWATLTELKKELIRITIHGVMMTEYLRNNIAPRGLIVNLIPRLFLEDKQFKTDWCQVSWKCTKDLLFLVTQTAKRLADALLEKISSIEATMKAAVNKNNKTSFTTKLADINQEMADHHDYLLKQKTDKLQKDISKFEKEKVYPYLKDDFKSKKNNYSSDDNSDDNNRRGSTSSDSSGGQAPRNNRIFQEMIEIKNLFRKIRLRAFFDGKPEPTNQDTGLKKPSIFTPTDGMVPPEVLTFERAVLSSLKKKPNIKQFNNLSTAERQAMDTLSNDVTIVIKQADKGGATVIQDRCDYDLECRRQLSNTTHYRPLPVDPTKRLTTTIMSLMRQLMEWSFRTPSLPSLTYYRQVLNQFAELFSLTTGQTNWCTHDVGIGDILPVESKIYRKSDHVKEIIKAEKNEPFQWILKEPGGRSESHPTRRYPKNLDTSTREARCIGAERHRRLAQSTMEDFRKDATGEEDKGIPRKPKVGQRLEEPVPPPEYFNFFASSIFTEVLHCGLRWFTMSLRTYAPSFPGVDTRLQKISLQFCEITGASCAALGTALLSNRSLLELGLSRNVLGDTGLSLICDALKEPDSRLQKIKLSKSSISSSVIDELKSARPELEIVEDDF
ncbi:uncharacterized protein LOC144763080 [Lissotriton helveticus]